MANVYNNYLENEVLHAEPLQLVGILYRSAIASVREAVLHVQSGAIRERSNAIAKAQNIIHELQFSLDHERGGQISKSLAPLYIYMQGRLIEANTTQVAEPLSEVEKLLTTLQEGWTAIRVEPASAAA